MLESSGCQAHSSGRILASTPTARGGAVPMRDWAAARQALDAIRAGGPYRCMGREVYAVLRQPESVRNSAKAVERAVQRFSELVQLPRTDFVVNKSQRSIMLAPSPGTATMDCLAEVQGSTWKITSEGREFVRAGGLDMPPLELEAELDRASRA
eukprot:6320951-Alexandrium_andersonii.AAC.1